MTTTINVNFGAWITTVGFILNDAMANFARRVDGGCLANHPAGGKRAQTAMAPVIVTDLSGAAVLVSGSAGAGEIVNYVAQAVLELLSGRSSAAALASSLGLGGTVIAQTRGSPRCQAISVRNSVSPSIASVLARRWRRGTAIDACYSSDLAAPLGDWKG